MVQLTRRNTRRYGGYLVHFGVVVIFIGIAGGAFNQSHEQEMNNGQSMTIGPYRIVCESFTQDSNPNYDTEFALLDVYRGNKKITQLAPEKRFYAASQQPSNHGRQPLHAGLGPVRRSMPARTPTAACRLSRFF